MSAMFVTAAISTATLEMAAFRLSPPLFPVSTYETDMRY